METIKITAITLTALGGVVMFVSFLNFRATIIRAGDLIPINNSNTLLLHKIHQALMLFFLLGYLVIIYTFLYDINVLGTISSSIIFFLGAIFVFLSATLQSNFFTLIRERQETLENKNRQLQQTEDVTIFALAYQSEVRDGETGKHLERTAGYVEILADGLQRKAKYKNYLTPEYTKDIIKSAPLHDLGKVGIPDSVLRKPGKLTEEEFDIIKKHCEYGANILREAEKKLKFRSFLKIAISLVESHHERWDGRGYPKGLIGEKIPLSGRIMALADVYDALRSKRCYKNAISHENTRDIIASERGKQFDPDVVDAFFETEQLFLEISKNMDNE